MVEYVCEFLPTEFAEDPEYDLYMNELRERVTRCRDCAFAERHSTKSIIGTEVVTLTCSGPIQGAYSEGAEVPPDGFCAWASPREGE